LLLAMVDLPDFGTPIRNIADSVERIADATPGSPPPGPEPEPVAAGRSGAATPAKQGSHTHV
jgi:hypothetical protein